MLFFVGLFFCNHPHWFCSAGTCEATPLSATAEPNGSWCGWRAPTPRCRMSCVPDRTTWRASASMTWTACTMNAYQRVSAAWVSFTADVGVGRISSVILGKNSPHDFTFPQILSFISPWPLSLCQLIRSASRMMSMWLLLLPAQTAVWFYSGTTLRWTSGRMITSPVRKSLHPVSSKAGFCWNIIRS